MLSRFFTVFIANSAIFWSMIGFCSKLCLTSYCSTDIKNLWFLHTGGTIFPECVSYFPGNTLVDLVATKQQHFNGILKKKKKNNHKHISSKQPGFCEFPRPRGSRRKHDVLETLRRSSSGWQFPHVWPPRVLNASHAVLTRQPPFTFINTFINTFGLCCYSSDFFF